RRKKRERRGELPSEVVHAEVGAVRADLFGRDRQVDGLQQHVGGPPRLRVRRGVPVAEGQEADLLHVLTTGDSDTFFPQLTRREARTAAGAGPSSRASRLAAEGRTRRGAPRDASSRWPSEIDCST